MPPDLNFQCDGEFLKLLTRRSEVDLTVAALELARDAYPQLDFQPVFDWIAERAEELAGPVARAKTEREALAEISHSIAETHGIYGDEACYERADSSFLHRVIETKRGIPISLSLLYTAVAERLGIELKGVSAPLHFLARYESVDGPLFVDAFSRGRILDYDECAEWIGRIAKLSERRVDSALEPARPRTIVIRMLNNLKALYARQENWPAAWIVQHRLTALEPASYQERRDLALISVRANRPGHAVDLLESCLKTCPSDEQQILEAHLEDAKGQLSRWN